MRRKKVTIKRLDASVLRPKKLKPFDSKAFLETAKRLEKAIKREEKLYGPSKDGMATVS